jgi:16S rRNA (cytidine1402-2'-O)-methyltransferase
MTSGNDTGAGPHRKEGARQRIRPNKGTLYIVSTPIGNSEDITLRALKVLRSVSIVAAEDSHVTASLLAGYRISAAIHSVRILDYQHTDPILSALSGGKDVALVCDAGTPTIADPGQPLVKTAITMGCAVISVPGPVAAVTALTASGIDAQQFVFAGFPPRTKTDRALFFSELAAEPRTIILYESRSHLRSTLGSLIDSLGDARAAALCRNLTRANECVSRGSLRELFEFIRSAAPRGEYTLVIAGKAAG